jgi:transposase-like protein
MSDHELRDLRRELAARERGQGKRYSAALRARISGWARRELERGGSLRAIAEALGLHRETLRSWLADVPASEAALVPVEVTAEKASARSFVVVSPSGFRVEGLALDEVAALLARLV